MRVQAYTLIPGVMTITIASARVEGAPSHVFTFAKLHEEIAADVRALLLEHRQCGAPALSFPGERRLATYFPQHMGSPIYALREIVPAGTSRDVDADFQFEFMRLRYAFAFNLLPGAFLVADKIGQAMEWHLEQAVKKAIIAAGINPGMTLAPGDETQRTGDTTEIDCVIEFGAATGRTGIEVPA